jgi:hypothetical protein
VISNENVVTIQFSGTQIAFFTPTYPPLGNVVISIDGQPVGQFSQGGSQTNSALRYTSPVLTQGPHTCTYRLDPNQGSGVIYFDAFQVI